MAKVKKFKIGNAVYNVSEITDIVVGTGTINETVADGKEYHFTGVTSLTLVFASVNCHGFVTFGSSPTINVSGATISKGDSISSASSNEKWEFSCAAHNGESFVYWEKWV